MAFYTGKNKQLAYITEVTYGVTPATPALQALENISCDLTLKPTMMADKSRNPAGWALIPMKGNVEASGDLEVALTAVAFDPFIAAALRGAWASNVLTTGNTITSFTFEEAYTDATPAQYKVTTGVVVDSFKLSIPNSEMVTATFGLKAANSTAFTATSIDADGYTPITARSKFFQASGTFTLDGAAVGYLNSAEIEVNNNYSMVHCLGNAGVRAPAAGLGSVKGNVSATFESATLYNNFINDVTSSLSIVLTSGSNSYTILIPKLKGTTTIDAKQAGPVTVTMSFDAGYDSVTAAALKITRV